MIMNSASPYYPPRARWYSRVFNFFAQLGYRSHLDKIKFGRDISLIKLLLSLAVPGYSFRISGRKILAQQILLGCGVGALVYVALLGYLVGNLFFGLVVGLHAIGLIHLNYLLNTDAPWRRRLAFGICGVLSLFLGYRAMLSAVENNWLIPLRLNGHVVVVNRLASPKAVRRGDVVAYDIQAQRGEGVYLAAGFGLNRVLGMARDQLVFKPDCLEVNGQSYKRHEMMPFNRTLTVPENSWFIWPAYNIDIQGHTPAENIKAGLLSAAVVPERQFVGRPFKSWFGRRQKLP
jgi:hypothetical protein